MKKVLHLCYHSFWLHWISPKGLHGYKDQEGWIPSLVLHGLVHLEKRGRKSLMKSFTSSGWDGINFLHGSWYGAIFWIYNENSVDTAPVFGLLLSSACIALRFPCSHSVLTASRLGLCKKWGGDVARIPQVTEGVFHAVKLHGQR